MRNGVTQMNDRRKSKKIWFSSYDSFLFHEGTNYQSYRRFGAHIAVRNGKKGVLLCLWAPNAQAVSVMHGGNGWTPWRDDMECFNGVWTLFLPGMKKGDSYRYAIRRPVRVLFGTPPVERFGGLAAERI